MYDPLGDSGTLVIPERYTPQVTVSFSLVSSLYQYLVYLSQLPPDSTDYPADPHWRQQAERISPMTTALGPLNFFEYPVVESKTIAELSVKLQARAAALAGEIADALDKVETLYRNSLWPDSHRLLLLALEELETLLLPHKDRLLSLQAERLGLKRHLSSYQVTLVPITYQRTGGYSHPTVISIAKFRGPALVEAIVHELTHVMAELNKRDQQSAYGFIKRQCELKGRSQHDALHLFHLLLFYSSGSLVREVIASDYVPYAESRNIYTRVGSMLRAKVLPEMLDRIWLPWIHGQYDLETAMSNLVQMLFRAGDE